jgi:5-methyltetrahydrofolate--homocysteine methyltransferase
MRKDVPDYVRQLAADMRKQPTEAESILWKEIRSRKLGGYRFQRQYPIGRYIADFYCSNANLAVEIDGLIHAEFDQKEYDNIRENEIGSRGIRIIRFQNEQILNNMKDVLERLQSMLECIDLRK